ncbi:MAG: GntR family transcriptional regulator, partial [Lachnospiraceae bacterium]|nr:GntR family transcriptional regulator [Lachnospiraceae bacterium]
MENIAFITKSAYTYERLKREIMDGTRSPGEKLIVNSISQQYNVSPMPVREALLRLEQEGLVQSAPHRGAWVNKCNYDQFYELIQVSIALESFACRLAALSISKEALSALSKLIEEMESAVRGNDITAYQTLNDRFHMDIYRASGNNELFDLINVTHRRTTAYTSIALHTSGRLPISIQEHKDWLEALGRRDSDTCVALCHQQRMESYFLFLDFLESCLENAKDPQNNYYLYGYSDSFTGMSLDEIRQTIHRYRSDII